MFKCFYVTDDANTNGGNQKVDTSDAEKVLNRFV